MPFLLVREPRAWLSRLRIIIHELLHNCGFKHSDALRTAQPAAVVKYGQYPWRIAINPKLRMPVEQIKGHINAQSAM